MKKTLIIIFTLMTITFCYGQTITRQVDEDKNSLVSRIMGENSYIAGPTYEFKDTVSLILFFEIKALQKLHKKFNDINHFEGIPTFTLFNVLFSKDYKEYRRVILDTLDINSGCCPCHLPATIDSILKTNENEIIVLKTNPVKHDCSSITSYSALLYSDLLEKVMSEDFSMKPSLTIGYYPFVEDRRKEVLKRINEKKKKE